MTDIAFASATRIASLIRRKKVSALEILDHYLTRVDKYNPALNAIIQTDIPTARKRAKAADRALAKGEVWGPFHGVPMTIKEAFDVAGMPTTWGVPEFKNNVAKTDSVAAERWKAAGAIIFGKTNVPVWLSDGQSFNAIYGLSRNPWNLDRTPGGSSGGSSAALAAGLTGIETGSDIASSIRNPAHNCGVYGHKPTYGLCPPRGHSVRDQMAADDINVIGPMARSAVDLEPALKVLAGPDEIEAYGLKYTLPAPRRSALKDFKVGIILNDETSEVDQEIQDALQALGDFLARRKVKVSDKARPDISMADVDRLFNDLLRSATSHRQTDEQFTENVRLAGELDPKDESIPARVLRAMTLHHRDWLLLNEQRHKLRWKWHEFFKSYDVLLAPVFPVTAQEHITDVPPAKRTYIVNGKSNPHVKQLFWPGYVGLAYLPATAAPIGFTKTGLPIGVQIIGPHFGDRTTIHFAKLLEREFQGFVPPPGYD
jgi:amidase